MSQLNLTGATAALFAAVRLSRGARLQTAQPWHPAVYVHGAECRSPLPLGERVAEGRVRGGWRAARSNRTPVERTRTPPVRKRTSNRKERPPRRVNSERKGRLGAGWHKTVTRARKVMITLLGRGRQGAVTCRNPLLAFAGVGA